MAIDGKSFDRSVEAILADTTINVDATIGTAAKGSKSAKGVPGTSKATGSLSRIEKAVYEILVAMKGGTASTKAAKKNYTEAVATSKKESVKRPAKVKRDAAIVEERAIKQSTKRRKIEIAQDVKTVKTTRAKRAQELKSETIEKAIKTKSRRTIREDAKQVERTSAVNGTIGGRDHKGRFTAGGGTSKAGEAMADLKEKSTQGWLAKAMARLTGRDKERGGGSGGHGEEVKEALGTATGGPIYGAFREIKEGFSNVSEWWANKKIKSIEGDIDKAEKKSAGSRIRALFSRSKPGTVAAKSNAKAGGGSSTTVVNQGDEGGGIMDSAIGTGIGGMATKYGAKALPWLKNVGVGRLALGGAAFTAAAFGIQQTYKALKTGNSDVAKAFDAVTNAVFGGTLLDAFDSFGKWLRNLFGIKSDADKSAEAQAGRTAVHDANKAAAYSAGDNLVDSANSNSPYAGMTLRQKQKYSVAAIQYASSQTGLPENFAGAIFAAESNLNPTDKAKKSSAYGIDQAVTGTGKGALNAIKKNQQYRQAMTDINIQPNTSYAQAKENVNAQALMGEIILKDSANAWQTQKSKYGLTGADDATGTYSNYLMGGGGLNKKTGKYTLGANDFWKAYSQNPNASVNGVVDPTVMSNNPAIFSGVTTLAQAANSMNKFVVNGANKYEAIKAKVAGDQFATTAKPTAPAADVAKAAPAQPSAAPAAVTPSAPMIPATTSPLPYDVPNPYLPAAPGGDMKKEKKADNGTGQTIATNFDDNLLRLKAHGLTTG